MNESSALRPAFVHTSGSTVLGLFAFVDIAPAGRKDAMFAHYILFSVWRWLVQGTCT